MRKVFGLAIKKIAMLFGGRRALLPISFLAVGLCLAAASAFSQAKHSDRISLAVVDECGDELSCALMEAIGAKDGFEVTSEESLRSASDGAASGKYEAVLTILKDYSANVIADKPGEMITLDSAPGSSSAELIRETVLGQVLAQRALERVKAGLEADGFDAGELEKYMDEFKAPSIYTVTTVGGGNEAERAVFGGGFPGYAGFAALALMLLMLTLSREPGRTSSRLVTERMLVLPRGRALGFCSDALAFGLIALLFSLLAFVLAPDKSLCLAGALGGYCLLLTGLCLLLGSLKGGMRLDIASPFIALVTSILGGCFADVSSLSPALALAAKYTPQGQLIAAASGNWAFAALLAAEGLVLGLAAFAARPRA